MRSLLLFALLSLFSAMPARAQMSFQGMNLSDDSGPPVRKGKKRKKSKRNHRRRSDEETAAPAAQPPSPAPVPTGMGLDLSGRAPTPIVQKTLAPPPAAMVLPGLAVGKGGVARVQLDGVSKQYRSGDYPSAALGAYGALQKAGDPVQSAEAEYLLAKSLYKLKMYHSALHHFSRVLARGEHGKFFKPSLEWLFFISRKTVDDSIVLDDVARWASVDFPARYQSEFRYLLARYYLERAEALIFAGQVSDGRAALREARRLVEMVPNTTPYYVKARFLAGTAAYQDAEIGLQPGQPASPEALAPALQAYKDVIRYTNPRWSGAIHDWKTRDLAFMDLARIHYEARQNRNAVYYYSKITRGGEDWLEALYEEAWAYYRMGDDERALGNMITLHSPFFRDEYFPESLTVKAIIYYENCRYEEAGFAIDDFDRIYGPVQQELERITAREQSPD
ncbi:MAG: adventurous gliding motility protein GltC, partial [Deltaproteobacteria bacterium]